MAEHIISPKPPLEERIRKYVYDNFRTVLLVVFTSVIVPISLSWWNSKKDHVSAELLIFEAESASELSRVGPFEVYGPEVSTTTRLALQVRNDGDTPRHDLRVEWAAIGNGSAWKVPAILNFPPALREYNVSEAVLSS
ncbi:hypothetical protein EPO15_14880, partial [bacterium]